MFQLTIGTTSTRGVVMVEKARAQLEAAILEFYGGFTIALAEGGWKGPGGVVLEPVLVYTIHGKPSRVTERALAQRAANLFSQDCVGIFRARGDEFTLVDPEGREVEG